MPVSKTDLIELERCERLLDTDRAQSEAAFISLLDRTHNPTIKVQVLAGLAIQAASSGSTEDFDKAKQLISTAEVLGDVEPVAHARLTHARGYLAFRENSDEKTLALLNQAAELYSSDDRRRAHVFDSLGMYFAGRGDLIRARDYFQLSHSLKCQQGIEIERAGIAITCGNLARISMATGQFEEAERWFREDLAYLEQLDSSPHIKGTVSTQMAGALMHLGDARLAEARSYLDVGLAQTDDGSLARAFAYKEAAQLALLSSQPDTARSYLDQCKALSEQHDFPNLEPWVDWLEALLLSRASFEKGDTKYQESLDLLRASIEAFGHQNMVRQQCEAYLAAVQLMIRVGDADAAHSLLVDTVIPIAERSLFEQHNPLHAIENQLGQLNPVSLNHLHLRRQLGGVTTEALTGRLRSRKKQLVIWSCDLRGFTEFSRDTDDPMVIVRMLNRFLATVGRLILDAGGTIDKYVGDNVLAYFDDADVAVNIALKTLEAMTTLNIERLHLDERLLEASVGIATGEVVQGNIGFAGKLEYTVIGRAVNNAFRLVSAADPSTILIDGATVQSLKKSWVLAQVEGLNLKGTGPMDIYRVELESNLHD